MTMYCGERDPDEIEIHDNAYILDDDEAEEATTPKETIPEDWFYYLLGIELLFWYWVVCLKIVLEIYFNF